MSSNYSKIYLKFGSIEITIEGDDQFVTEQYREIFSNESKQNTITDINKEENFVPEKTENLQEAQKTSAPAHKKIKTQTPEAETTKSSKEPAKSNRLAKPESSNNLLNDLGTDFGKWLASLPDNVETRDKILAAAYYNQTMNSEQKFYVRRIRTLLNEHEVTVSNLSGFLDTYEIQKIIAKVADSSRKGYQFTKEGKKYIEDLLLPAKSI